MYLVCVNRSIVQRLNKLVNLAPADICKPGIMSLQEGVGGGGGGGGGDQTRTAAVENFLGTIPSL